MYQHTFNRKYLFLNYLIYYNCYIIPGVGNEFYQIAACNNNT